MRGGNMAPTMGQLIGQQNFNQPTMNSTATQPGAYGQQQHQQQQQQQQSPFGGTPNAAFTGPTTNQQSYGMVGGSAGSRLQHKGVPQVIPNVGQTMQMNQQQQQQQQNAGPPNLMQKLNEITAPGGDILSKGKELIFMKFGLGGK